MIKLKFNKLFIIIVSLCFLVLIISLVSLSAADESKNKLSAKDYNSIEREIISLKKQIKEINEYQNYYLVFDNYKVGIVGLILTFSGMIIAFFVAFMTYKVKDKYDRVIETEKVINSLKKESKKILSEINERKVLFDDLLLKSETRLILMIDQLLLAITRLSENKAYFQMRFEEIEKDAELSVIIALLKNSFEKDKYLFYRILYQVNLFHPDEKKVWQALLFFGEEGNLDDISILQIAKSLTPDSELKMRFNSVMRNIKKRTSKN